MPNKPVQDEKSKNTKASVKYVYVNKKTGKITKNPATKSNSESIAQGMTVVFVVLAVIIVMIAGSMFISGYMAKSVFSGIDNNAVSESTLSDIESSDTASAVSSIPPELLSENLQNQIKGTWSTNIPYKSMSIPATLVFDGDKNCSCVLKAMFISKEFEGSYRVSDGGSCSITLEGLEEYVESGNTMVGTISFSSENEMIFTSDSTVWQLNRVI